MAPADVAFVVYPTETFGRSRRWPGAGPVDQRAADLLAWAEEVVARYEPIEDKF